MNEPIGVVAAITRWNLPVASEAQKMVPALVPANDSVYALAAGIWSRDYKRAWRIGHEKGRLGIFEYMEQKSFY